MSEPTKLPWRAEKRNWCNEPSEHDWYISGDVHETYEFDEEGELVEDGLYSVAVAVVKGNATAGDIPRANAELIVRAVNSHVALLEACESVLSLYDEARRTGAGVKWKGEMVDRMRAAVAKAKGGTP